MPTKINLNLDSANKILSKRKLDGKAQKFFSSEIARLSDPYVPFRDGPLKNTVKVSEKSITYVQPYARRQWYENKGNGLRGKEWCIRMFNTRGKEIVKSVANYVGGEAK